MVVVCSNCSVVAAGNDEAIDFGLDKLCDYFLLCIVTICAYARTYMYVCLLAAASRIAFVSGASMARDRR